MVLLAHLIPGLALAADLLAEYRTTGAMQGRKLAELRETDRQLHDDLLQIIDDEATA